MALLLLVCSHRSGKSRDALRYYAKWSFCFLRHAPNHLGWPIPCSPQMVVHGTLSVPGVVVIDYRRKSQEIRFITSPFIRNASPSRVGIIDQQIRWCRPGLFLPCNQVVGAGGDETGKSYRFTGSTGCKAALTSPPAGSRFCACIISWVCFQPFSSIPPIATLAWGLINIRVISNCCA